MHFNMTASQRKAAQLDVKIFNLKPSFMITADGFLCDKFFSVLEKIRFNVSSEHSVIVILVKIKLCVVS